MGKSDSKYRIGQIGQIMIASMIYLHPKTIDPFPIPIVLFITYFWSDQIVMNATSGSSR